MMDSLLESLTPSQRQAATHVDGPLLILAGPGSGKTRVVTHRIAYLLRQGVPARQILALTFTNKAADEMRLRLGLLAPRQPVWLGTFHRFCARLLRQHASLVGLKENFSIYDIEDSRQLLKQALEDIDLDLTYTSPDRVAGAISWAKNELITAEQYQARSGSAIGSVVARAYPAYQARLLAANAADFDDLLMHVATLLRENPELRATLDQRYRYILVDEYQDTNLAQYAIVRAISIDVPNLAVTGDPDQSIYGWRGANLNNILQFDRDYPSVHVVRLEENYRSTPNILRVADRLIAHNVQRKEKTLFTQRPEGKPVRLVHYPTSYAEADGIAQQIHHEIIEGRRRFRDMAIFYRINALSRSLENALRSLNIPYQIVSGVEFYQRKEIKDVMACLQLLNNPQDDAAFLRIVNVPPRGIGKRTIERLSEHARRYRLSLFEAARESGLIESLPKRAAVAVAQFVALFDSLSVSATRDSVQDVIQSVLDQSGYRQWLKSSDREEDDQRLANIEELLTAAEEFDVQHPEESGLEAFLEQVALVSETDDLETDADQVTMMTLHAAKGLEFPVVFIAAVESGFLPHERSKDDPAQQEEERRLLFVGITRAEDELQLSTAKYRSFRGRRQMTVPSSFLMELPHEDMQTHEPMDWESGCHEEPGGAERAEDDWHDLAQMPSGLESAGGWTGTENTATSRFPPQLFKKGMVVDHPNYGSGTIEELSGNGKKRTATVEFFGSGERRTFRLAFSPLVPNGFDDVS